MHPDNSQNIKTGSQPDSQPDRSDGYNSSGGSPDSYRPVDYGQHSRRGDARSYLAKNKTMDFAQLITRYQDRLFNMVLRMVGNYDDAQELTQEAFLRAFKGAKKFRGDSGFYTWLFRIGINLCINHHRRRSRVHFSSLQASKQDDWVANSQAESLVDILTDSEEKTPLEKIQNREDYNRVLLAIEKLEPNSRAVVILRDVEQLNYAEIAQVLDLPTGTVKSRLSRARNTLRKMLM